MLVGITVGQLHQLETYLRDVTIQLPYVSVNWGQNPLPHL